MEFPSQARKKWTNTFTTKRRQKSATIALSENNRSFLMFMSCLQVVVSSILMEPSFTTSWWTWLEINTALEASKKFSLQILSIWNSGKLQDIMTSTKRIFLCLRLKMRDSEWSQWTVLVTASCSKMSWDRIVNCQFVLLILVFCIETKFRERCQAWLGLEGSVRMMHIFSVRQSNFSKR